MSYIDLTKIPTPELLEMRNILKYGASAYASEYVNADGSKRLKALAAENERLKKAHARRDAVESAGLEWDDPDYWLGLDDKTFQFVLGKFTELQKEVALAEKTFSRKSHH